MRSSTDTPKRYRYTDKELDQESGLSYHGARYYAPWLGRWTACDPTALTDGLNLYSYGHNNPLTFSDPSGTQGENETINTPPPDLPRASVEDVQQSSRAQSHWGGALQDARPGELPDPILPPTQEDIERMRKLVGPIVPELKYSLDPTPDLAPGQRVPWYVPVDTSLPSALKISPPSLSTPPTVEPPPVLPARVGLTPDMAYPDVYAPTRVTEWKTANPAPPLSDVTAGGTAPSAATGIRVGQEIGGNWRFKPILDYLRDPLAFFTGPLAIGAAIAIAGDPQQKDPNRATFGSTALGVATGVLSAGASEKLLPKNFTVDVKLGVNPSTPQPPHAQAQAPAPFSVPGARYVYLGVQGVF